MEDKDIQTPLQSEKSTYLKDIFSLDVLPEDHPLREVCLSVRILSSGVAIRLGEGNMYISHNEYDLKVHAGVPTFLLKGK